MCAGFEVVEAEHQGILNAEETHAHMHASLFSLAPTGAGFGVRLKFALLCGSIPVICNDHVRVRSTPVCLRVLHSAAEVAAAAAAKCVGTCRLLHSCC